jgi:hypothetical protein
MDGAMKPKAASRTTGLGTPPVRTFPSVLGQPGTMSFEAAFNRSVGV